MSVFENATVEKSEDGPVLNINGDKLLLRTFLYTSDTDSEEWLETVDLETEVDMDGDMAWWNLVAEDAPDESPWVSIQPELIES